MMWLRPERETVSDTKITALEFPGCAPLVILSFLLHWSYQDCLMSSESMATSYRTDFTNGWNDSVTFPCNNAYKISLYLQPP